MNTKPETKPGALALAYIADIRDGWPMHRSMSAESVAAHADLRALIARAERAEAERASILKCLSPAAIKFAPNDGSEWVGVMLRADSEFAAIRADVTRLRGLLAVVLQYAPHHAEAIVQSESYADALDEARAALAATAPEGGAK